MRRLVLAILATLSLLAAPAAAAAPPGGPGESPGKPLTVMTRNVYLGGDIMRPLRATEGKSGLAALLAFANANDALADVVKQTSFPTRADLLADEIADQRPDVVGLQEVALWRTGPVELDAIGVENATDVEQDFLAILMDAIAETGANYRVVQVQVESDVEAPAFSGSPFDGTWQDQRDVRLTMRDVLLVRVGHGLKVLDSGGAQYDARFAVEVAGVGFSFVRGYVWADIRFGSQQVRVINTHLESVSSDIALAQAKELVAGPASTDGELPTVILCDCNSDPLNHSVKPRDSVPHSAAYDFLVQEAGFTDQWLEWAPASEGWTSGLSETVDDTTAAGFDHRIDLVLGRSSTGDGFGVDRGTVTGDEVADRDPETGLWPSDHAGVVLRLRGVR